MASSKDMLKSRAARVRRQLKAVANGRPRLSVFRSSKNIYAQIIDDVKGATLASASTLDKDLRRVTNTERAIMQSARPVFRLLSETTAAGETDVVMGHADGVITINVTEASNAVTAERQEGLDELYRTMLGHMRHEMAHFLFLRLSQDPGFVDLFRALFGDETADYAAALRAHYAAPQPPGETHITSYATAHPHEDWAETIAHLLHLVDLADSAAAARLALPEGPPPGYDAYAETDTETVLTHAVALSLAINHVNRALDLPDLYPFVLSQGVRDKIAFAHAALRGGVRPS